MTDRRPNDKELRLFCCKPFGDERTGWPYWRFIVEYPDYDFVEGAFGYLDVSEPLGDCLTPPVLPNPCWWEPDKAPTEQQQTYRSGA